MSQGMVKALLLFLGGLGVVAGVKHLSKKRVFVSFAIEDKVYRDLLVSQAKNKKTPFEFIDKSVKEPWSNSWKTQCKERMKSCDGVIVLVTENTTNADGVHWEVKIYKWSWKNIENFIEKINK